MPNKTEIDADSLIEKVAAQHPIWDNRLAIYSAREIVDDCWRTISRQMDRPEHKLRKKWKYLRDQFCVELGKIAAGKESQWAQYNSLTFLADVVKPRQLRQSASMRDSADDDDNSTPNDVSRYQMMNRVDDQTVDPLADDSVDPLADDYVDPLADESHNWPGRSRKRFVDGELKPPESSTTDSKVDLFEKVMKKADLETDDDDMLFFRSLLPYVSKIEEHKKLRFRSKILRVVDEFAYSADTTASDSTVT